MELKLKGKLALVTASSRGIGQAIAARLAEEGARVALVSRDKAAVEKAAKALAGGAKAGHIGVALDLCDEGAPAEVLKKLKKDFGAPEIVVHNLGGSLELREPLLPVEDWRKLWRLNVEVAIELNNLCVPAMQKAKWGRLLHVSSVSGVENLGPVPYCTVKAALTAYVRAMGRVLASDGIVLSAVLPGAVLSEGGPWDKAKKERPERVKKYLEETTPLHRFGEPDEVASLAAYLCSPLASQCVGSVFQADGGVGRGFQS